VGPNPACNNDGSRNPANLMLSSKSKCGMIRALKKRIRQWERADLEDDGARIDAIKACETRIKELEQGGLNGT
jgi:hypothetical protein